MLKNYDQKYCPVKVLFKQWNLEIYNINRYHGVIMTRILVIQMALCDKDGYLNQILVGIKPRSHI